MSQCLKNEIMAKFCFSNNTAKLNITSGLKFYETEINFDKEKDL